MNIDSLGISKLKWIEMGEFNSDYIIQTIISTTVGKNPLEEMESSPHGQQKCSKCSTWVLAQK